MRGLAACAVAGWLALGGARPAGAATAPAAPVLHPAVAGPTTGSVTLKWGAPANGGSPISRYDYSVSADNGATWQGPLVLGGPSPLNKVVPCAAPQTAGQGCQYRIYAVNAIGRGPASNVRAVTWAAPSKVQNLAVSAGFAAGTVTLHWHAPGSNGGVPIDAYRYDWSNTGNAPWTTDPDAFPASATSANVPWPCSGTSCWFRMRAHNPIGSGALTPVASAAFGAPRSVQVLSITVASLSLASGAATVDMQWDEPDTNGVPIDYYEVQQCAGYPGCGPTNGYWNTAPITNIGATLSWSPTCPAGVEACAYRIRAHNAYGSGPWRHKFLAPYAPYTPAAATSATPGSVDLSWSPTRNAGAGANGYVVYSCNSGCTSDANWSDTGLMPGMATTATHACGTGGVTCEYRLGYRSADGTVSVLSSIVTSTGASPPDAPTSFTAASGTSIGSVDLSWSTPLYAGTSPVTGYWIARDNGSGWSTLTVTDASTFSFTDSGCGADTSCAYRIAAVNAVGVGGLATASATGANVPGAPQSLGAAPGTAVGAVDLTWQAPATLGGHSVTSYSIERKLGVLPFLPLTTVGGSTLAYTDGTCGARVSCAYRVTAVNALGGGAASGTASALGADVADAPTLSAATGTAAGAVDLSWTTPAYDGGQPINGYTIERDTGSGFAPLTTVSAGTLTFTDGTCGASNTCTYRVAATTGVGQGAYSNQSMASGANTPSAPQNLAVARGTSLGAIDLTWQAPSSTGGQPITGYVVQRDTGSGFGMLTTVSASTLTLTDGTCGASVTCAYRVAATNAIGTGAFSGSAQTQGADVPGVPETMAAQPGSVLGAVDLSWAAPADNGGQPITAYRIDRDTGSGFSALTTVGNVVVFTDTTCGANTSCTYRVAATSSIGTGGVSGSATALGASTPTAVQNASAAPGSTAGSVDLSWAAPASAGTHPITSYRIERKIGAGSFGLLTSVPSTSFTYTDTTCGQSVSCSYRVAAINAIGAGPFSATATATGSTFATAPQNLVAATGNSIGAVDLSWGAPASNGGKPITGYTIERKIGLGVFSTLTTVSGSTITYTDTTCGGGVTCTYRVYATTIVGSGATSNQASADGANTPNAPTLTATTSSTALRYVDLSWTVPTNNGGHAVIDYQYRVDTTGTGLSFGAWTSLGGTATSLAHLCGTSDTTPTTCAYQVRAVNSLGAGTASNTATAASLFDAVAPAPTITSPTTGTVFNNTQIVSFSGTAGNATGDSATVTVTVYSGSGVLCSGTVVQTLSTTRTGATWSLSSSTLADATQYHACVKQSDWAGNTGVSATATQFTVDLVPTATDVQSANGPSPAASHKPDATDTLMLTFSKAMAPASIVTGLTAGGSVSARTVRITDATTGNDTLSVDATNLGAVDLGSSAWVMANITWTGSTLALSANGRVVTITFGAVCAASSGNCTSKVNTVNSNVTLTWTPTSSMTSALGTAMSTTAATESGTADADF
jgi:titin